MIAQAVRDCVEYANVVTHLKVGVIDYVFAQLLVVVRRSGQEGVVSKETQLKVLSLIDNVKDEIAKMEEEAQKAQEQTMQQAMTFGAVAAAGAEQEQEEQPENPEQLEEETE